MFKVRLSSRNAQTTRCGVRATPIPMPNKAPAAEQRTTRAEEETPTEKIYIGKGRFIDDDPSKYPSKDRVGTGGWAGGEAGLWKFRQDMEAEQSYSAKESTKTAAGTMIIRKDKLDGDELIYLGKGEYVKDDSRKYPGKEGAGIFPGATGGFRGGELGVQQFNASGNLKLADAAAVKQRLLVKDLLFLGGVVVLAVATFAALLQLGVVAWPEAASGAVSGELAGLTAATGDVAARSAPLQLTAPTVSREAGVAAAAAGAGALLAFVWRGAAATAAVFAAAVRRNASRVVVLGAAAAVAYQLLLN